MAVILASKSPRRQELLRYITEDFTVKVSDADETLPDGISPRDAVIYLARLKGEAVFSSENESTVISADTIVELDGKILGKPHSEQEAYEMLSALSGRSHLVYTGVYVRSKDKQISFAEVTEVTFCSLTDEEIRKYIESKEPFDKAGGYGIQGRGCTLVSSINGDFYNVMGFPVARLNRILRENSLI